MPMHTACLKELSHCGSIYQLILLEEAFVSGTAAAAGGIWVPAWQELLGRVI
jgi:hypothetical protein